MKHTEAIVVKPFRGRKALKFIHHDETTTSGA
jgi:hypothetical protein